ncbi:MAG: TRAP transporter small permease [Proteobacteria bacterium]|nr:TRAP transporter small permease [Pseudomonadota bacterium]
MVKDLKEKSKTSGKSKPSVAEPKSILQIILEWCTIFTLGGVIVLLSAQVVIRHIMGGALPWSGEIATWLFSWTTFIGATLVFMEKKHIVIDFLVSSFPPKLAAFLNVIHQLLILSLLIILLVKGVEVARLYSNQTATSISLSTSFLFVALPISSALMIGWMIYGWIRRREV